MADTFGRMPAAPGHSAEPGPISVVPADNGECPSRKATGGMSPKRKGYCFERETVNFMRDGGLECRRVPLSGAGYEKGDITVKATLGKVYRGELKRRKCLPDWIVKALGSHDFMAMRGDRGECLIVLRACDFRDLLQ